MDPPSRAGRRSVRRASPAARRARGHDGDRRLPVVRRLGPRHDDRAARPGADHRPSRAGRARAAHLRALRRSRHAAEPLPRRQRRARVQHGGRHALVVRGDSRDPRRHRRLGVAEGALARARERRGVAPSRHPLRHRGGSRRRAAAGGGARRAAHVDGRARRRLGRHAAHRQAGRDQRALVQRAVRDGRLRARARATAPSRGTQPPSACGAASPASGARRRATAST